MKVLVTGATGGLGELVVNSLVSKHITVIATSRDDTKAKKAGFYDKVIYKPYDINSRDERDLFRYFEEPDALIHLAWEKLNEYRSPEHLSSILESHKAFVANLVNNGLKNITGVGTCYEYGIREGLLEETLPAKPVLPYSQAKNFFREYLEAEKSKHGFSFKWIRLFYVFGEVKERKNLYTLILNAVKNGDVLFNMSSGEQVRDFLSPTQMAECIVKVALQDEVQGVINGCSGVPVKLKEFILAFLEKNNFKLKLNLGFYPYADYEPMNSWGSVNKLNQATDQNKFEN